MPLSVTCRIPLERKVACTSSCTRVRYRVCRLPLLVGHLPERPCLIRCKPVAQARARLANTLNAMDSGGQFRAQQSRVSRLVSQLLHGRIRTLIVPADARLQRMIRGGFDK